MTNERGSFWSWTFNFSRPKLVQASFSWQCSLQLRASSAPSHVCDAWLSDFPPRTPSHYRCSPGTLEQCCRKAGFAVAEYSRQRFETLSGASHSSFETLRLGNARNAPPHARPMRAFRLLRIPLCTRRKWSNVGHHAVLC
jgi:hypothetical protein